jgi:hypothetical protein
VLLVVALVSIRGLRRRIEQLEQDLASVWRPARGAMPWVTERDSVRPQADAGPAPAPVAQAPRAAAATPPRTPEDAAPPPRTPPVTCS